MTIEFGMLGLSRLNFEFGNKGNNVLIGGDGIDVAFGRGGNDSFFGGRGNDTFFGGRGFDTAIYSGGINDYSFSTTRAGTTRIQSLTNSVADAGRDTLFHVEALHFQADDYTLYLDGTNNAVLAADDTVDANENGISFAAADLLGNDQEFDGDALTVTGVDATSASGASVSLAGGIVTYTPDTLFDSLQAGQTATDTFTYTVDDGKGGTDTATVTVTIHGENDAPRFSLPNTISVLENTTAVTTLAATDVDSSDLTYALSGSDAALFSIDQDSGLLTFTGAPDFEIPADQDANNSYEIIVTAADEHGGVTSQNVTVQVQDAIETPTVTARINEIHYDNAGTDTGEFVEIRVTAGGDISQMTVELYNGSNGATYASTALADLAMTSDGAFDYYVWNRPTNGIQNGARDGLALSNAGDVIEFLSYEGTLTATNGTAAGLTSTDIGVAETSSTEIGQSLQRDADGTWQAPASNTLGGENGVDDDGGTGGGTQPDIQLISEIQGSGADSAFVGAQTRVSAVVTRIEANGFWLQEEDADADGNALTSEGIFVFTGGGFAVELGNLVEVTGTVDEFFGLTQIDTVTAVNVISDLVPTPTAAQIILDPETVQNFEAIEGMLVSVTSGTPDPLTVITNFNLDRFGQIEISAGVQYQPTQLFDAQTQADEIAALAQANENARLLLDDGNSQQNPDGYAYLPGGPGDTGNGFLDAGDNFGEGGSTLRLGAELTAPVEGVLTFAFGDYQVNVSEQLDIDEATNSGARQATPDDVGGNIQVASINVLNYFTTLDQGSNGTGPSGTLDPRGADTAEELERQTDALVDMIQGTGAEAFAIQEIENNGFGEGSAIATLVDELNSAPGSIGTYGFANPTEGLDSEFLGTDAITTGILYDTAKLRLVHSEFIVFEEASAATTFALAEPLNAVASSDDQLGNFQRNRPSVAATFEDIESGETFTLVSSHFKSKGDSNLQDVVDDAQAALDAGSTEITQAQIDALIADPNFDQGNGQGFWNQVRADAAAELIDWLETSYNGGGTSNYLLLGDLNAYAQEDPVQVLTDDNGLTDLIDTFIGQDDAYSFVFDGQRGALDHGLADDVLAAAVTGATEWHINADEPDLLNYDTSFKNPGFFAGGPYAASDHDPLIIGLDLDGPDSIV